MVFAQYGYKTFHNENTEKHPIQPYHWDNWIKMVNNNVKYCAKMNWFKMIEFYFWIIVGRVRFCDLPSFHRYWKHEVRKNEKKSLKILISKYELCKKNPTRIKYLFNKNTSLKDIENRIDEGNYILVGTKCQKNN